MDLEEFIKLTEERGWIDCTEGDTWDADHYDLVLKTLKAYVTLRGKRN